MSILFIDIYVIYIIVICKNRLDIYVVDIVVDNTKHLDPAIMSLLECMFLLLE